jgi:hypothetical protein
MFGSVFLGFVHGLKKVPSAAYFAIGFGTLVGHVAEGFLIDLDHWRHLYVALGLVWGLMAASARAEAEGAER